MSLVAFDLDKLMAGHPTFWNDLVQTVGTRSHNEPTVEVPNIINQCIIDLWPKYFSGRIVTEGDKSYRYFKIEFDTDEEAVEWILKN